MCGRARAAARVPAVAAPEGAPVFDSAPTPTPLAAEFVGSASPAAELETLETSVCPPSSAAEMAAPREVSGLASTSGRASMRMRSATMSSSPACSGESAPLARAFARRRSSHLTRSSLGAARIAA